MPNGPHAPRTRTVAAAAILVCALGAADARTQYAAVTGSAWITTGKARVRASIGSSAIHRKGAAAATIMFGPREGLTPSEFVFAHRIDSPSSALVARGTFALNGRGKPKLKVDRATSDPVLEATLIGLLEDDDIERLAVQRVKVRATPRQTAHYDEIKLRFTVRYNVFVRVGGRRRPFKVKQSYRGHGSRSP